MITAEQIHAALGERWRDALIANGIGEEYLKNKHGPCPACGGKDRFRFDNKLSRGTFFCSSCGPGNGFDLLMRVHSWPFKEAYTRMLDFTGLGKDDSLQPIAPAPRYEQEIARPTDRVRRLLRESCSVENCDPVMEYLASRRLWPLPEGHTLRAHPSADYWNEGEKAGRFPAIVARIVNGDGELVTAHITYVTPQGEKLTEFEPRKILSPMTGHVGRASRLVPVTDTMGIAEGIETALSAMKLFGIPTWAALNSSLLAQFEPPAAIKNLVIFTDNDIAGLEATIKCMQSLQNRVKTEYRKPNGKDFNDDLRAAA